MTGCEFEHEGFCCVADEFPEMKDDPCPFNKKGLCTAKESDLVYVCPDCYRVDCDGSCATDESFLAPKTVPNKDTETKK
jgi:hypothetical protein